MSVVGGEEGSVARHVYDSGPNFVMTDQVWPRKPLVATLCILSSVTDPLKATPRQPPISVVQRMRICCFSVLV